MPDDHCDTWNYPFPIVDIDEFTPGFTPEQTPYILCETKKAQLWAHQGKRDDYGRDTANVMELRNESCLKIGRLHLHNDEQRQLFPKALEDDELGKAVELVAIYRSRIYSKTRYEENNRYTHPLQVREVYVVLWIEQKDGVSCRLASGEVEKDAWEELDLKDISLVLG